jgi:hypothetical protein
MGRGTIRHPAPAYDRYHTSYSYILQYKLLVVERNNRGSPAMPSRKKSLALPLSIIHDVAT